MAAHAKRVVVGCIDPRVLDDLHYQATKDEKGKVALITTPGSSMNVEAEGSRLSFAINTLGAREAWIVDHEDCLGFEQAFSDNSEEKHFEKLEASAGQLRSSYPSLKTIRLFIMRRITDGHWEMEEVTVTVSS